MLHEIKEHSQRRPTSQAYYRNQPDKVGVTRELIRRDLRRLREWQDHTQALLQTCDAEPRLWIASAIDLSEEPRVRIATSELIERLGIAGVTIIAGSQEQARERFRAWRDDTSMDWDPLGPVQQSWWPSLMRRACERLRQRLGICRA